MTTAALRATTERATADTAVAAQMTSLLAEVDDVSANLSVNYYTKSSADAAIAAATMALESSLAGPGGAIGGLTATLSSDYYTKTDADAAISAASTTLKSSMEGAGGSVRLAQDAAQAATDLAGGKGKVFFQSAAPAASERLAQSLWIDTTGGRIPPPYGSPA